MSRQGSSTANALSPRERALSRWENEGGAIPDGAVNLQERGRGEGAVPQLTNAELVALRVRLIALENLVIALLATASDHQLQLAREMAGYISPRPGFSSHPLTIQAATHMTDLVQRSTRFRSG